MLNLLGVFTVSSFHAYICARSPSLLSNLLAGRGASRKRGPLSNNQSFETSIERQNSAGTNKSYDDDEDFNESSLVHVKVPGKKVQIIFYFLFIRNKISKTFREMNSSRSLESLHQFHEYFCRKITKKTRDFVLIQSIYRNIWVLL